MSQISVKSERSAQIETYCLLRAEALRIIVPSHLHPFFKSFLILMSFACKRQVKTVYNTDVKIYTCYKLCFILIFIRKFQDTPRGPFQKAKGRDMPCLPTACFPNANNATF